ncbi:neurogenic locus notch homolog 2-like [Paramuricea clavata]|uniref:Neurogenic locus notch homolog 2-like n=1 Tax=Paramuricea clavata TaxID=317549 RepID=A0A6S7FUH1_PARCT|nr:neurogenic locus notch homolog 2-like [Paramuricea clavata]
MENGDIPDSQLSASSEVNVHHGAVNARLNFRGQGSRVGAWCGHNDLKQWLEVNFVLQATVTDILTQGRFRHNQWVTKYTVSYSNDGLNFFDYRVNGVVKVFDGNRNRNGIVSNSLSPVILTKHIRIHPKKYYGYTCMRVDFRGCLKEWPCEARPCRNAGTCFDFRGHYRCACAKGWGGKNCEQNIDDPCDPTPCRNGGTCLAYRGHYRCACGEGWAGKNCEQNVGTSEKDLGLLVIHESLFNIQI